MKQLISLNNISVENLKSALLPVLRLCAKNDEPLQRFIGGLCVDVDGDDLVFWTCTPCSVFSSRIRVDDVPMGLAMTIPPSNLGTLLKLIKEAEEQIELSFWGEENSRGHGLRVVTENGDITIKNDFALCRPPIDTAFGLMAPEALDYPDVYVAPKKVSTLLQAFKEAIYVNVTCISGGDRSEIKIRTTDREPVLRFEARVLGFEHDRFDDDKGVRR